MNTANADNLIAAAKAGDLSRVRALLDQGIPVSDANSDGGTALHAAATGGHIEIATLLLDRGADPNAIVRYTFNIDVATEVEQTLSPLYQAAGAGYAEIVKLLLDRRADTEQQDFTGATPLMAAIKAKKSDVARILLEAGANPNGRDGLDSTTAISLAAGQGDLPLVRLLIDKGVDRASLPRAIELAASYGKMDVLQFLRDFSSADESGSGGPSAEALSAAAMMGQIDALRMLLENVTDLSATGGDALIAAANAGHLEAARLLLDRGAPINCVGPYGWTPLMHAAWQGHRAVAQLLLEHGANQAPIDTHGKSVLDWVAEKDDAEMLGLLKSNG